jgi:hypothetical protein
LSHFNPCYSLFYIPVFINSRNPVTSHWLLFLPPLTSPTVKPTLGGKGQEGAQEDSQSAGFWARASFKTSKEGTSAMGETEDRLE